MEINNELNDSIYNIYSKLITIKKKDEITLYPYSILNDDKVIFTKNQIELNYKNNFNTCDKKKGGIENSCTIFFY